MCVVCQAPRVPEFLLLFLVVLFLFVSSRGSGNPAEVLNDRLVKLNKTEANLCVCVHVGVFPT